ncbi:ribosome recycling factor [candidate division WOR-3 bacterium]|uniref:Ribosome-recycling factor n=1 Tax=candidate division WOR-3 bacterium TaxID=2052148 RepID=A0A660SI85_UNCW3|nr:MAG: ribosome recycling factor [candidate division WOR-3 bacterium]
MWQEVIEDAEKKMKKSVEFLKEELLKIRSGRAHPALVEGLKVEYYGSQVPLKQIASIGVPEPRQLVIQPWDKTSLPEIEKAILKSELGITPKNEGNLIRLILPPLTEERRRDLVKMVNRFGENQRIAIRNIRREANELIKDLEKEGEISEDEGQRARSQIQKLHDRYIEAIEEMIKEKEKELLQF